MRKLIWLIPILLLLACSSPCPLCPGTQAIYREGQNSILLSLTAENIPDSVYKEIYDMGYRHGQMGQQCDVCIRYPTREQVLEFLAEDKTDKNAYNEQDFNCADFSGAVIEHAWQNGIPCYLVCVDAKEFEGLTHTIVAFPLQDRTLMFVEPQNDGEVKDLEVGKQPYICVDGFCEFTNITVTKVRVFN